MVEDDPDVRQLTLRLLSGLRYRVLDAADGPSALSLLDSPLRVDLLLTDVVLGKQMNGVGRSCPATATWPQNPLYVRLFPRCHGSERHAR